MVQRGHSQQLASMVAEIFLGSKDDDFNRFQLKALGDLANGPSSCDPPVSFFY